LPLRLLPARDAVQNLELLRDQRRSSVIKGPAQNL
jgi:hypothetical protein